MSDVTQWGARHRAKREEKKAKKRARRSSTVRSHSIGTPEPQRRLGALDLSSDLIVVSLPTWNTPPKLLERATASVLNGSHRHVRVVVISDGEATPGWEGLSEELRSDPRLVCVASPRNLGPYFNHDVVLRTATGPLFAVQDSDDVSHPDRFTELVKLMHGARRETVHANIMHVNLKGKRTLARGSSAAGEAFAHRANHFGLYGVDTLMQLGGYHAGFRVGYDTNITSFLNLLTNTQVAPRSLYTRHQRAGSLTMHKKTGHGSSLRQSHRRALKAMWEGAYSKSQRSRSMAVQYIRRTAMARTRRYGDLGLRRALVEEVSSKLAAARVGDPPPVHDQLLARVIGAGRSGSPWAISVDLARWLYRECERRRPKVILDVGSGMSTAVLALYAARYGATVKALEDDASWRDDLRKRLERVGLWEHIELIHAPLRARAHGTWYEVDLSSKFGGAKIDLAFIDGPPSAKGGRAATAGEIASHLAPKATLLLHDALRAGERADIRRWQSLYPGARVDVQTAVDRRGLAVIELQ